MPSTGHFSAGAIWRCRANAVLADAAKLLGLSSTAVIAPLEDAGCRLRQGAE